MNKPDFLLNAEEPSLPEAALPPVVEKGRRKLERPRRFIGALAYGILLVGLFSPFLVPLSIYATNTELHSHTLLIPFVSAYLIFLKRRQLPRSYKTSSGWTVTAFGIGLLVLGGSR